MFITEALLKKHDACDNGITFFKKKYPNGCELNDLSDIPTNYVWWFYNAVQQDKSLYQLCGVNNSDGVNWSGGVNNSFGVLNSYGVDNALFLCGKPREYSIFGKPVTQERFTEVQKALYEKLNSWQPVFNNIKALWLDNGQDWKLTPVCDAEEIQKADAWRDMPEKAVEYVKSLPEFDAAMFEEITGLKGRDRGVH